MALSHPFLCLLTLFNLLIFSGSVSEAATFTLTNQCSYPVWPGILSNAGIAALSTTGFSLQPGESNVVPVPESWSGRMWARTLCSVEPSSGQLRCLTADCGPSLSCIGGAVPPATLAEFTLNGANNVDFYDVSLVDGYNLPMLVSPSAANCSMTGCVADLNEACPSELKVMDTGDGQSVACKSACDAFGDPQYCCSGAYATPDTCKPTSYSQFFKTTCPKAYSYAYDDGSSTFTCSSGADYHITFCPSPNTSLKSANDPQAAPFSAGTRNASPYLIGGVFTVLTAIWHLCSFPLTLHYFIFHRSSTKKILQEKSNYKAKPSSGI